MKAVAVFLLGLCCLAISHAWICEGGPQLNNIVQIDAGQGKVVALDSDGHSWFLSGKTWHRMSKAPFKHVSVGKAGLWASTKADKVYKYVGGDFVPATGLSMQQVDAGSDQLVGVDSSNTKTSCLKSSQTCLYNGEGTLTSNELPRALKYYSCGPLFGCWGVDSGDKVYVTKNMNSATCDTSGWTHVDGGLSMIEVGTDGTVFGVSSGGHVHQRVGISSQAHEGTQWHYIPMCMSVRHLSYDLGSLWVVTTSGILLKCTA